MLSSYNPDHNILALFNNLAQVWITTSKTILDIYHSKLGAPVASPIAERLESAEQEILEKCQMWLETQHSAQSSFQKSNVDNSRQKTQN